MSANTILKNFDAVKSAVLTKIGVLQASSSSKVNFIRAIPSYVLGIAGALIGLFFMFVGLRKNLRRLALGLMGFAVGTSIAFTLAAMFVSNPENSAFACLGAALISGFLFAGIFAALIKIGILLTALLGTGFVLVSLVMEALAAGEIENPVVNNLAVCGAFVAGVVLAWFLFVKFRCVTLAVASAGVGFVTFEESLLVNFPAIKGKENGRLIVTVVGALLAIAGACVQLFVLPKEDEDEESDGAEREEVPPVASKRSRV